MDKNTLKIFIRRIKSDKGLTIKQITESSNLNKNTLDSFMSDRIKDFSGITEELSRIYPDIYTSVFNENTDKLDNLEEPASIYKDKLPNETASLIKQYELKIERLEQKVSAIEERERRHLKALRAYTEIDN